MSEMSSTNNDPGSEDRKISEKRGWPKGRKRKPYTKEKDENAPRRPVNGYVRYMQDKREAVSAQNPDLSFAEVTKILGNQWTSLAQHEKQKYLDDAESDRAEYLEKLKMYNLSKQSKSLDVAASSRDSPMSMHRKSVTTPPIESGDIPIFTEAFLDHNKAKDAELRQLRKSNAEYAEQSAMLQRNINNLENAITKLDTETQAQNENNYKLKMKILSMKELIVKLFKDLPLPDTNILPTVKNTDAYMKLLFGILQNPQEKHKDFVASVQEIMLKVNKNDLQSLLMGH